MAERAQILPGTLDLLILKAVSLGPLYGYGILLRIQQISHGALLIEQGALYPCSVSTGTAGIVEGSLGHIGEQPTDQVLRADNRRAETFAPAGGRLEPPGRRNCLSAKGAAGGNVRAFASFGRFGAVPPFSGRERDRRGAACAHPGSRQ
jgi:hypothetical protein